MVAITAANILGRSGNRVADPIMDLSNLAMPARYDVNDVSLSLSLSQSYRV